MPDELSDLVDAVADQRSVDWAAAEARAASPMMRARIDALRLIARVAETFEQSDELPSPHVLAPGTRWAHLEIMELLGAGTFGAVYRARDLRLERDVALKLLHQPPDRSTRRGESVIEEGRHLARVKHPNVVQVFGADLCDGRVGVWMELVDGETLEAEVLRRGPLPVSEVISLGTDLSNAVARVHAAGLIHRDVKLQNIMRSRDDGRIVLMDFSAGREMEEHEPHAFAETLAGSPAYLAPEVLAGRRATTQSDVYSVGVALFRLLTARLPVEGASIADIAQAHADGRRHALADMRPGVPRRLAAVVDRALTPAPRERFRSASELADALRACVRRPLPVRVAVVATVAAALIVAAVSWNAGRRVSLPFNARDWVLVAGFQNLSGDATFDGVLETALVRELAGSGFVNVVPRPRVEDVLALMKRPPNLALDARTAREVCVRDGEIKALVTGRIERLGPAFVLTAEIVRPSDAAIAWNLTEEVPTTEALPAAVYALALRVRRTLGEAVGTMSNPSASPHVTTPSLDALRLYAEAASLIEGEAWLQDTALRSRYETAEALLRRAVDIDPAFASAWILLAQAQSVQLHPATDVLPIAERALAVADHATPAERYFIEGVVHRFRADAGLGARSEVEAATRALESVLRLAPDHYWAVLELAPLYRRLQRHVDADRVVLHAAAIRPHSIKLAVDALGVLMTERKTAEVTRRATELVARTAGVSLALDKPAMVACYTSRLGCVAHDVASLRFWRVADAWLDGDANAALDRLREVDRTYPGERSSLWTTPLFYAYLGLGRFAEARQVTSRVSPAYHSFYEAIADARAGDAPAFDRVVGDLRDFDARDHFSFMLIWMRRLREADLLARERRAKVGSQPMPRDWIEFEGQLRQAQGRSREAVAILEPFARDAEYPRTAMHAVLAEAQWQSGDTQGALETLAFTDRRALAVMPAFGMYDWLKCRVLLVRIYRGLGGDRRAAEVEREVRQLLAASEPDNPLLLELDAIAQVHAMPAGDLPAAAAGARSSRARLNDRE